MEVEPKIRVLLKAYIGNLVFDNDGFYPIFHRIDNTFQVTVKHITSTNN